ncbi:MAG: glycoside hydrolase family 127 protein [Bacteroidota bacterium]
MNYYKRLLSKSFFALLAICCIPACQTETPKKETETASEMLDYPIQPIAFTDVQINDNFWAPRIETNRKVTIPYNFKKSEETGRIRNFAIAGDLEEGEFEGIFFNDSDVFKIIEGAAYSLMVHEDPELDQYLDDLIYKIAAAQEEDGYLYTNRTIDPSKAADGGGAKRWTSLGIHHELYNVGHMYEAAVAHYQATGKRSLLEVALKNADLVDRVFGPGKNPGFPGHQEIEIGLVKLFRVTGEKKYLDLAKFFVDQRGSEAPYESEEKTNDMKYQQAHKLLAHQEEAVGHSVRAGYFYSGATDVAALTGETAYDKGLDRIWKDIVHQKIYLTGGIGAEPRHEGFGPDYELPNASAYTETCAAIALMFWNHRMFLRSGDVKYMDVFERTLYNGFLAGVSFEGNTFFYPNPLEADGIKKFNQGVCGRSPWFDCSCCPVNIVRVLPSLPGYIYAVKDEDVFVNLYIGNEAKFAVRGEDLQIKQTTNYPWDGTVQLEIGNEIDAHFNLRIPGWARNEVMPGDLYNYIDKEKPLVTASVNGEEISADFQSGYLSLDKKNWKKGDKIELSFDMPVRKVESHELVEANKGKIALERGPLVYCAEEVDNPGGVLNLGLSRNAAFTYTYDTGLFSGLGKIKGKTSPADGMKDFTAIPYYAWAHRKMGEMAVWLAAN